MAEHLGLMRQNADLAHDHDTSGTADTVFAGVQLNKESSIKTIDRVAVELGEDVDWLFEVAIEMEPEDGVNWVFSVEDKDGVMAFTPLRHRVLARPHP